MAAGTSPSSCGVGRGRSVAGPPRRVSDAGWLSAGVDPGRMGVAARSSALADHAMTAPADGQHPGADVDRRPCADRRRRGHHDAPDEGPRVPVRGRRRRRRASGPAPSAVTPIDEDPFTHDLEVQRERCLLFVACTRAREELAISWHGRPGRLLVGCDKGEAPTVGDVSVSSYLRPATETRTWTTATEVYRPHRTRAGPDLAARYGLPR